MESKVHTISIECIRPNINQPRQIFNDEGIEELSQSIKAYGILQPLTVRCVGVNKYEIIAGERRFRAAQMAGLTQVPAIIRNVDDKDSAVLALLENLQREDLNFLEEAEAFQNLIKTHSYKQEQLAEIIGKSQSTIANKLRVLKLDKDIRDLLLENNLTERHARSLLKCKTKEMQMYVMDSIIKKDLNVKETERLIEHLLCKESDEESKKKKKAIKGYFNPKIYVNTIREVFDKFGIKADYKSKESEDFVEVTVRIARKDL
ncbi:chromosome partitioning protein, ParB family [Hathewaya proteolytica DSM 3090]|uniref:Chromosome partitioning protein, ParB family n=1 Tax=Hathewaya proteolytica DSM 3090 TaxID=1121331 RepID=A0A1M6MNJ0_9CLOT|nr:nucleoid occlusion protein [Hathewaya proteolytica]SHJ85004.1 chromosome partitioning protein, ParB family [Hathewaya proteolytica DSM 3090]